VARKKAEIFKTSNGEEEGERKYGNKKTREEREGEMSMKGKEERRNRKKKEEKGRGGSNLTISI